MAYNGAIYSGSLLDFNKGAAGALGVLNPLLAQIDLSLFGSLGIGALQANFKAQLDAAISASASIGLSISNPYAWLSIALDSLVALQAQIAAALSGALPVVSLEASAQLSAMASLTADLELQIGGLEAMIQAALAVKIPAMTLAGQLSAALSAGPVFVLTFEDLPLTEAGASLASDFSTGLSREGDTIAPTDRVYGVVVLTKAPAAWAGMQATLRVQ